MNQEKIGKFILECRKEVGLTQQELADSLGVTDRAVSKWENGRGLPDHSLLLPLAKILNTNVNELLLGERINKADKDKKQEELLLQMAKTTEIFDKRLKLIQNVISFFIIIFTIFAVVIFVTNMVFNYLYPETYNGEIFDLLVPFPYILFILGLLSAGLLTFSEKYRIIKR